MRHQQSPLSNGHPKMNTYNNSSSGSKDEQESSPEQKKRAAVDLSARRDETQDDSSGGDASSNNADRDRKIPRRAEQGAAREIRSSVEESKQPAASSFSTETARDFLEQIHQQQRQQQQASPSSSPNQQQRQRLLDQLVQQRLQEGFQQPASRLQGLLPGAAALQGLSVQELAYIRNQQLLLQQRQIQYSGGGLYAGAGAGGGAGLSASTPQPSAFSSSSGLGPRRNDSLMDQWLRQQQQPSSPTRAAAAMPHNNNNNHEASALGQLLHQRQLEREIAAHQDRLLLEQHMAALRRAPADPSAAFRAPSFLQAYLQQQQLQQQLWSMPSAVAAAAALNSPSSLSLHSGRGDGNLSSSPRGMLLPQQQQNEQRGEDELQAPVATHATAGGVLLSIASDQTQLSTYHQLVRNQLEFFVATQVDSQTSVQGRKKGIRQGQVGIRCIHCAHVSIRQRGRGSVYYPKRMQGVYQVRNE